MIGKDFQSTGTVRSITHRIGDGNGYPFQGSIRVCFIRRGVFAVLTKDNSIIIRNLRGYSEHIFYPLSSKEAILQRKSVRDLLSADNQSDTKVEPEEDWQAAFMTRHGEASHNKQTFETESSTAPFTFIDMQPTDICKISGKNALAVTDSRFFVHILDLDEKKVTETFGRPGYGPGEFTAPTAICTLSIPCNENTNDVFYFVGDSLSTQKVRVLTATTSGSGGSSDSGSSGTKQIAEVGGLGPALGQFKNISSISSYYDARTSQQTRGTAPGVKRSKYHLRECLPSWYRGRQCFENLESMLYEESFAGNFLVGQRKERVFESTATTAAAVVVGPDSPLEGDAELDSAIDTEESEGERLSESKKEVVDSQEEEQEQEGEVDTGEERTFDVLYISPAKRLEHLTVRENKSPGFDLGFYVSNSVAPVRETFPCLMDLLLAQKQQRFTLGGDARPYVFVAVCDQGNYRVQIFRFYWTKNFMFRPEFKLAYVLGGAEKQYIELFDPAAVAYSPTGELAVCDAGTNKVFVLSPLMDMVQCIAIPYCSLADYQLLLDSSAVTGAGVQKRGKSAGKERMEAGGTAGSTGSGSGRDYLEWLSSSLASTITLTDRELHPEKYPPLPVPATPTIRTGTRGTTSRAGAALLDSVKIPPGTLTRTTSFMSNASVVTAEGDTRNLDADAAGQSMRRSGSLQSLTRTSSTKSTKLLSAQPSSVTLGTTTSAAAVVPRSIDSKPLVPKIKDKSQYLSTYQADAKLSPEAAVELRRRKGNKQPSTVAYSAEGQLAVGFKSGGLLVYPSYESLPMGTLCCLQTSTLERVLSYLSYPDIESLRNCCLYLHNFTKELRLSWRFFAAERTLMLQFLVHMFVSYSKRDNEGVERPQFPLCDADQKEICPRHLRLECENPFCPLSHKPLAYRRSELARLGAYITHSDFLHVVSAAFDPRFLWQYEVYIQALFEAYGADRQVVVRHDPMTRAHETVRTQTLETVRVLYFPGYLEVLTLLEEQRGGWKDLHGHKLFRSLVRTHFVPKVDYRLDAIERRLLVDPAEQYTRPLGIPAKRSRGKKLISLKGMEQAERSCDNAVAEHCAIFNSHADKAASLLHRMFS